MSNHLPLPSDEELLISQKLTEQIIDLIDKNDGFIPFEQYWNAILYTPHLGYYSGSAYKIGRQGDFTTAPQLTDLFGKTWARQIAEILPQTEGNVYEFGAGTGVLATDLLEALAEQGLHHYYIIEISPNLRARQQETIVSKMPQYANRVIFLDRLPEYFDGVVIGNEILDAVPCQVFECRDDGIFEMGVTHYRGQLQESFQPACKTLIDVIPHWISTDYNLPYRSEITSQQTALTATIAQKLRKGALMWIDYGFDENEFYHPQRNKGTMIGHYRHHTVQDPFFYPALMDWTAHVNFSAIAAAATSAGLDFIGYTHQASFLLSLGITDLLEQKGDTASENYIRQAAACQKLLNPQEMGEIFKVIGFGKNINPDWTGFNGIDLSRKL